MNIPLVDLKAQYNSIKDEIDGVVSDVLSKSAFIGGSYVSTFETAFAGFCKTKHCVGVGNGTDALFIALKTLGIGCGDEVITAANSFIAASMRATPPVSTAMPSAGRCGTACSCSMPLANTMKPMISSTKANRHASKMSLTPPMKPLNRPGLSTASSLTAYSTTARRAQE